MSSSDVLEEIVVRIYLDKNTSCGTGFLVADDMVATCCHVLTQGGHPLQECYYVKHARWPEWIKAEPIVGKCHPNKDVAVLKCLFSQSMKYRIPLAKWDNKETKFRSLGYDRNTTFEEGANTVKGSIVSPHTSLRGEPRLQLRTVKDTLLEGRSGSPVWSESQQAIVGMVDYWAGDESISTERSMAIPIEALGIENYSLQGKPVNVPALPNNFLLRPKDLDELCNIVLSNEKRRTAITGTFLKVGLQGMGGIGKSVLASALVREERILKAFSDGVIWITLGQQPDLLNRQIQLIRYLEPDHHVIFDLQDGRSCLSQLLQDKSCLIILDDVWKAEHIQAFNVLGSACGMLITTRDMAIVRYLEAKEYRLGVLNDEDSLELLAKWSNQDRKSLSPQTKEVAKECDNLPLALAMVGAMARGKPNSWEYILHRLRSADLERIKAEFPDYPYHNLLRAIEVSVEVLEPELQKKYTDLAVFPEDANIPVGVLQILWGMERYDVLEIMDSLADRSLVMQEKNAFKLHDLQHDFVLKRVCDQRELHGRLVKAYEGKSDNWPLGPNDGYFFQHIAYHLLKAGRKDELHNLLMNPAWMYAKLDNTDIISLLSDYDFSEGNRDLRIVQSALMLSAHVIASDSTQLRGQLYNRLICQREDVIRELLERLRGIKAEPWLRAIKPCLSPAGGPLIQFLSGHKGSINAIAVAPNGNKVVSGSDDCTLKIWDLKSGREIRSLEGHVESVDAIAISPDSYKVISGSQDGTLKIWDIEMGQEIRSLEGHTEWIRTIAITPDGRKVVSGSSDCTIKIWDMESGLEIKSLKGHEGCVRAVAITPDGRKVVSGSDDCTLKIWDLESGQEIRSLEGHTEWVFSVAITPDGQKVVSGSQDGTLKIWDLNSGRKIRSLNGHAGWVEVVAITPDGRKIISGSDDCTLKIWDLKSGREIRSFEGYSNWICALVITPDGKKALSGSIDDIIRIWDLEISTEIESFHGHTYEANVVAITPDSQMAISGSNDNTLKVWDLKSGQKIWSLEGHADSILKVAITPDGRKVISGSRDNTLKIWDLKNGTEIKSLEGHIGWVRAVAITPDGCKVVSGSQDCTLKIWDIESGREIRSLKGHKEYINSIAISQNGQRIISGSGDGTLKIWDLKSGREIISLKGHTSYIAAIGITPDNSKVISGDGDSILKIWDLKQYREITSLESYTEYISSIAILPDGRKVISGSGDGTLKIWDLENGQEIGSLEGHTDDIAAISITPDGCKAITGSFDHTLRIWDLKKEDVIAVFNGDGFIRDVAFDASGSVIVAVDSLGNVHILQLEAC